jgi:alkylation response protein AidB-like acyl-CoA dehydrogenase
VVLSEVRLPAGHAIGLSPAAAPPSRDPVQAVWGPVAIAALYDGIARGARDWLFGYLNNRRPSNLGASLASLPRFQALAGEIEALLLVNRRLIDHASAADETDAPIDATEAGLVKQVVTANAIRAVELGLASIGNAGLSRANPIERHLRDVLCSRIHTPQDDVILATAGRAGLGL